MKWGVNMNYNLPFYGKKGTISSIEENDKNYIVHRYDITGKENLTLEVPKNTKNYNKLVENYYIDLKDYLITNNNKYEYFKRTKAMNKVKASTIIYSKIASIALIAGSLPLVANQGTLGYLGITLDAIAIPVIISSVRLSIKENNNEKKARFINKYNELAHRLIIYNEGKSRNISLTKYSEVKTDNKEPKRDLRKILEKKKVS